MNMQGGFAERMNIVSSQAEFQFRSEEWGRFIVRVSKLRDYLKSKAPPQAAGASASLEELKKLKERLDMDAITQEEYAEKKKKLLEEV